MKPPLPIDAHVADIVRLARERRAVVVVAPPGAGKTTRVPPALAAHGAVLLLQPRRVAARAIARRIAEEQGWTLGREVGWQVRFDSRFAPDTRLLVATEGILTARLASDPLLGDFATVVLDEFHERSLHADSALALTREAMAARHDLRLVVMSATLDARPVAEYLGRCPVVEVPGRPHPVEVSYAPELTPAAAVRAALAREGGHVLCFLPGAPEIRRLAEELGSLAGGDVYPLHGTLDAEQQEAALRPSSRRKILLATNLAETSLTVDGVTEVIDTGFQKVLRHDPARGLDRLETERISRDSADQRAGRAGRTGPGRVLRLWDARQDLRPHREPEIERVDLARPFLEVLAWGGDPRTFAWFEPPSGERSAAAMLVLERLGATRAGRLTELGAKLRQLPLHPRLGRLLVEARGARTAAAACAILAEGWTRRAPGPADTTSSDLLALVDRMSAAPVAVKRAAEQLHAESRRIGGGAEAPAGEEQLLRAVLAGFPDRVARRRAPGSPRLVLATGGGAVLARESGVRDGEFLVALELVAGPRGPGSEALVRVASHIESSWLEPTARDVATVFDPASASVKAVERSWYDGLILSERPAAVDRVIAPRLLAEAVLAAALPDDAAAVLRRTRFAGIALELAAVVHEACAGRTSLRGFDLASALTAAAGRDLERLAPEMLPVPSGRKIRLDYRDDGTVLAAVKLQELFGLAATPLLGPRREPVAFALLAPNGRPVQTTRDLRSFWERTYPEVRKELAGRYRRHPWPEDPWTATPTAKTRRRR